MQRRGQDSAITAMSNSRGHSDHSTDGALRPTTSNATSLPSAHLRTQNSQASLRSGAGSAASMRSRQNRDLFAPSLSRRAPSRNLRHHEDVVLVDSDSDRDRAIASTTSKHRGLRRTRRLSGDLKSKSKPEDEIVNRQSDGSFIRPIPGLDEAIQSHLEAPELVEEAALKGESNGSALRMATDATQQATRSMLLLRCSTLHLAHLWVIQEASSIQKVMQLRSSDHD